MRLGVLGLAPVAAAVCLVGVAGGAGTASFSDSAGDSGEAPDVISITVANDDQGLISFTVTIANRATFGPDDAVAIPFATNAPGRAGVREDGVNFVLGLEGTQGAFLERWTGADMVVVRPAPSSLRGSFADGVVTLTVRQDDLVPGFPSLAVPTELSFYVLGVSFNGAVVVAEDDAPDASDQFWSYRLVQPPRIIVTYFRAPKIAKPGAVLVARVGAAWSDTGRVVKPTKVSCRAKLGSRVLKGRASAPVLCSWTLPTHSAGMTLRGTVTLTSSGMSVTRSFTTRVR
jgi:hypothetical protein